MSERHVGAAWEEIVERLKAENARYKHALERAVGGKARFEAENARLRQALKNLAEFDTDWTLDLDENMARARAAARRALKERSDG